MSRDFVFFWAWQITIVDSSRTLACLPSLLSFLRAKTNCGLGVVNIIKYLRHWSRDLLQLQYFDVQISPNPSSCIRTGVHWVWEQFSLRMMTLDGSMLLLILHKAITLRRPNIHPTRKKFWRQCGLLPISTHIYVVSVLLWWLTINLYDGSWSRISLMASLPCGLYCSRSMR